MTKGSLDGLDLGSHEATVLCPAARNTRNPAYPTVNDVCGKLLQVFYQGIDKVSKVVDKHFLPDEDSPDDSERDAKVEGAEGVVGEGGGDGTIEPAEDPPAKEDDEPEENGEGENHELTDEELAARCRYTCLVCCGFKRLNFLFGYGAVDPWNIVVFLFLWPSKNAEYHLVFQ